MSDSTSTLSQEVIYNLFHLLANGQTEEFHKQIGNDLSMKWYFLDGILKVMRENVDNGNLTVAYGILNVFKKPWLVKLETEEDKWYWKMFSTSTHFHNIFWNACETDNLNVVNWFINNELILNVLSLPEDGANKYPCHPGYPGATKTREYHNMTDTNRKVLKLLNLLRTGHVEVFTQIAMCLKSACSECVSEFRKLIISSSATWTRQDDALAFKSLLGFVRNLKSCERTDEKFIIPSNYDIQCCTRMRVNTYYMNLYEVAYESKSVNVLYEMFKTISTRDFMDVDKLVTLFEMAIKKKVYDFVDALIEHMLSKGMYTEMNYLESSKKNTKMLVTTEERLGRFMECAKANNCEVTINKINARIASSAE